MIENLSRHKSTKFKCERIVGEALGPCFSAIWNRLLGFMRSKSLKEILYQRDLSV